MTESIYDTDLFPAPGGKVETTITLSLADQEVEIPVFLVNGTAAGPTLAVTGGIHGAEYASIEAALQLGRSIEAEEVRGKLAIVPVVNVPAFYGRLLYVSPLDNKNLNRLFPGNPEGTASEQLADWLYQSVISQADFYVDLHGGDLVEGLIPFTIYCSTGDESVDQKSIEMARAFGIRYVVKSESTGSTFAAAARGGVPSILTEAGGQGLWPPEPVRIHREGLDRLMTHLGMLEGTAPEPVEVEMLDQFVWLRSEHRGFYYPKVEEGQVVEEGEEIGFVSDFKGNVLQPLVSPVEGKVLFLVTSLAVGEDDPLIGIGK